MARRRPVLLVLLAAVTVAAAAAAPAEAGRGPKSRPDRLRLNRAAVKVGRVLLRPGKRHLSAVRVVGAEHVASVKGSVVLASNHIAGLDPVAIALASPKTIRFYAKKEIFRVPVLGRLVRAAGAVPIDRGNVDLAALNRVSAEALAGDDALGVFTEGTLAPWSETSKPLAAAAYEQELARGGLSARRLRKLERKQRHLRTSVIFGGASKSGAAHQAVANDRPIIPVVVLGTRALETAPKRFFAWLKRATGRTGPPPGTGVTVIFGAPISPPTSGSTAARVHTLRDQVDRAMRELARPYLAPTQTQLW